MNRIVQIALIAGLLISLAANAMLGLLWFTASSQTKDAARELDEVTKSVAALETDLADAQQELKDTQAELAEKTKDLTDMTSKYAAANRDYREILCGVKWTAGDLDDVGSNREMAEFLSGKYEEYYGEAPVDVTFELLWSNIKTALFTVEWPDNSSSKTLVSWEPGLGHVERIYDPGEACFLYVQ
jgi:hypothetical protein